MIWLMWRQHRLGVLILGIMLAVFCAYLISSGQFIGAGYHKVIMQGMSAASCAAQHISALKLSLCQTIQANFYDTYEDPNLDMLLPMIFPILVGMFLGAPLVARELEQGTFLLAWTQGVTRLRWFLVKVGTQLVIILTAFVLFNQVVIWYLAQNGSFGNVWHNFEVVGIMPLAYMVFALALGVAAGAITRSTIFAVFVTLLGYIGVRSVIENLLLGPCITYAPRDGTVNTLNILRVCPQADPQAGGLLYGLAWQPIDHFWLAQGIEGTIFFALAAGLLVLAYWWIREGITLGGGKSEIFAIYKSTQARPKDASPSEVDLSQEPRGYRD